MPCAEPGEPGAVGSVGTRPRPDPARIRSSRSPGPPASTSPKNEGSTFLPPCAVRCAGGGRNHAQTGPDRDNSRHFREIMHSWYAMRSGRSRAQPVTGQRETGDARREPANRRPEPARTAIHATRCHHGVCPRARPPRFARGLCTRMHRRSMHRRRKPPSRSPSGGREAMRGGLAVIQTDDAPALSCCIRWAWTVD